MSRTKNIYEIINEIDISISEEEFSNLKKIWKDRLQPSNHYFESLMFSMALLDMKSLSVRKEKVYTSNNI